jgi:hypothetical protein
LVGTPEGKPYILALTSDSQLSRRFGASTHVAYSSTIGGTTSDG